MACRSGFPCIAMSPTKPLDVVILMKNQGNEDSWEPYREYGETEKASIGDWSCYILAKEEEVSVITPTSSLNSHADLCSKPAVLNPVHEYDDENCYGQDIHRRVLSSTVSPPSERRGRRYRDMPRDGVAFHDVSSDLG